MKIFDYECQTTFWQDFSIAEVYGGTSAIKDTFNRAFKEWKSNHVYLTELVMVLNHKMWGHYENGNLAWSRLYQELFEKASGYALKHLKGEELTYYLRVTD